MEVIDLKGKKRFVEKIDKQSLASGGGLSRKKKKKRFHCGQNSYFSFHIRIMTASCIQNLNYYNIKLINYVSLIHRYTYN